MIKTFTEYNSKIKFLMMCDSDTEVANNLNIKPTSFSTMKRNDNVPFEETIKWCVGKNIDLNWLINIQNQAGDK